ncbi:MAG: Ni/Fe hydrogenase subunit alpha [Methanomicrobiales archaeon]|nr:Ni/Fe hydrogenase subunit alpha [Methanomicrobiales archaeon]
MTRITINPVTRIEGHAQVSIDLDKTGAVEKAHFKVVELRGFERFLIGAAVEEAPRITPRICGICPTSHHVASAMALDQIYGVEPPPSGKALRELLMLGQYIHSHSLHFFMLAAPDYLIGHDAPAGERNVLGLVKVAPDVAKKAIEVRKTGQRITEAVGGKPIHPTTAIPGGMSHALDEQQRSSLREMVKNAFSVAQEGWAIARTLMEKTDTTFATIDTGFMGLSNQGAFSFLEGNVQMVGPDHTPLGSFRGVDYLSHLEEYSEDWSYLKFCRRKGGQHYRVGPLARLNLIDHMGTPTADAALKEYRGKFGNFVQSTLAYNIARYVEFLWACERALQLLEDPVITDSTTRVMVDRVKNKRGIGIIEAPRGTLIHDYSVTEGGIIEKCNLIVATCQNNYAIDRGIEKVARDVISNGILTESASNRIEMAIRAYDPCLSCATHMLGSMPIRIRLNQNLEVCRR